jgi:hypothetical protein
LQNIQYYYYSSMNPEHLSVEKACQPKIAQTITVMK